MRERQKTFVLILLPVALLVAILWPEPSDDTEELKASDLATSTVVTAASPRRASVPSVVSSVDAVDSTKPVRKPTGVAEPQVEILSLETLLKRFDTARTLADPAQRMEALDSLARSALHDRVFFAEVFARVTEFGTVVIKEFAVASAKHDPAPASELVLELPVAQRNTVFTHIAPFWVERGIEQTKAWLKSLPDGSFWAGADPLLRRWQSDEPEVAALWAEELAGRDGSESHAIAVAGAWASSDPDAAYAWVLDRDSRWHEQQAIGAIAQSAATNDAQRGIAWVDALPPGPSREVAIDRVSRTLLVEHAPILGVWLSRLPATPARDQHLVRVGARWAATAPAAAVDWSLSIAEHDLRTRTAETAIRVWLRIDRDAANDWLSTADIPPEIRERIGH